MVVSLSHFVQKPFRDYAITVIGLEKLNWLLTSIFAVGILIVFLFYFFRSELRTWIPRVLLINGVLLIAQFAILQQTKECLMIYCLLTGVINLSLMSATTGLVLQSLSMERGEKQASVLYLGQAIAAILGPLFCLLIPVSQASWVLVLASALSFLGAFLFNFVPAKAPINEAAIKLLSAENTSLQQVITNTFFYTLVSILFYYLLLYTISSQFQTQTRMTAFAFAELGSNLLGLAAFWLIHNSARPKKSRLWMLPFFSLLILIGVTFCQMLSLSIALLIFFKVIKNGVRSVDRDISLLTIAPSTFIPTKNLLDTVVYRSGDMAGGWIVHWLNGSVNSILVACGLIALLWLLYSIRITRSKSIN
jgi:hypothetical protein